MKTLKTVIVVTLIIAAGFGANAQLTGTEIVEKAYNRETGDDQTSNLSMTLINRSGAQRIRKIKQFHQLN